MPPRFKTFSWFGSVGFRSLGSRELCSKCAARTNLLSWNSGVHGTHVLQITTLGDTAVPATSGVTFGRALGTIDYLSDDERYGTSANQMLIDTYTTEGVHNLDRYHSTDGRPVHLDIENFSQGTDMWGDSQPRSGIPSRLGMNKLDVLGGVTASIFPMGDPQGQHGFDMPGRQIDTMRKNCLNSCEESWRIIPNPCNCVEAQTL